MNALTEEQQQSLNQMPVEHDPCPYRVTIELRRSGSHRVASTHTTYVRASSERRAKVVGFDNCKNLFGPCWRKRGLIPFNSYARVAEPVDLGCAEREVSCER